MRQSCYYKIKSFPNTSLNLISPKPNPRPESNFQKTFETYGISPDPKFWWVWRAWQRQTRLFCRKEFCGLGAAPRGWTHGSRNAGGAQGPGRSRTADAPGTGTRVSGRLPELRCLRSAWPRYCAPHAGRGAASRRGLPAPADPYSSPRSPGLGTGRRCQAGAGPDRVGRGRPAGSG